MNSLLPSTTNFTTIAARVVALTLPILLASYGNADDADLCSAVSENYLQDADFALEQKDPRSTHWNSLQHAGEDSFKFSIESGELTVKRTGSQPWGVMQQKLRTKDLGGARVAFTADLKLDLRAEGLAAFPRGGGLSLAARSGSNRILRQSVLNHKPRTGKTEWQQVRVIVDLPKKTKIIDLGFLLQTAGSMQVRNPSFHRVDTASPACAVTPDLFAVAK